MDARLPGARLPGSMDRRQQEPTKHFMSQTVERLKELLFDSEAQALAELARRLDTVAATDAKARAELAAELKVKIDQVMERAGSAERFTASVAEVLDEALRRAEVSKHSELSLSIAPLVVSTIKTELKNSQDEMVEALYPITGRLVKAYVASAIKDLTEDMNRRLEQNPVMLRLQSITTGRSVAELALAGTQDFELLELFLIRRGSGELVAHWPEAASGRQQLLSGVLAAVNAFANEAFAADEGALRQIDLGEETVYLRRSQLYLLAAKCSGTAPKGVEQALDDAFLATIEKELDSGDGSAERDGAHEQTKLLAGLGSELKTRVAEQKSALARPAGNPLKVLAALILLPLLGWFAWSYYSDFANGRTRDTATRVIASTADMRGYPARLEASQQGRTLRIAGLAPSQAVKDKVLSRLTMVLPRVEIRDELAVVPGSDISIPDTTPQFDELRRSLSGLEAQMAVVSAVRALERAGRRISDARTDLAAAAQSERDASSLKKLEAASAETGLLAKEVAAIPTMLRSSGDLAGTAGTATAGRIEKLGTRVAALNATIAALAGTAAQPAIARTGEGNAGAEMAAELLAAEAERLAALASVTSVASRLKPPPAAAPVPRAVLADFAARHAVFFANGIDYRDAAATERTLEALVPLVKSAGAILRVVGYTDDAGTAPTNTTLAQDRAERVRQDLISRGAPASLLVAVGRRDSIDLSPSQGLTSPNRRVAFELTYEGEIPQ